RIEGSQGPRVATTAHVSKDCQTCHAEIFKTWSASDHAHAHRPIDPQRDAEAFIGNPKFSMHGVDYQLGWKEGHPTFAEQRGGQTDTYTADFVLGEHPLYQYIVPAGNGRYQAAELARDPANKEWFNVFDDEQRRAGE